MQEQQKKAAAEAALAFVVDGATLGVGTGSTVNYFIDALPRIRSKIRATLSSSEASTRRLQSLGFRVLDANEVDRIPLYVDGADEANGALQLIKGGGGALTREKIIAAMADLFVCIADAGKQVAELGTFPLPVEVIPMARNYVTRVLAGMRAKAVMREGFVTDNGNIILDVRGLRLDDPRATARRTSCCWERRAVW